MARESTVDVPPEPPHGLERGGVPPFTMTTMSAPQRHEASTVATVAALLTVYVVWGSTYLGIAYVVAGTGLLFAATPARAWRLFFVSILYLPALLTLMVLDKVAA
jgi:heme O synthase-like polyprenyltransferase